ncbi:hypothetical protein ERO13_D03G024825v2 [Gossypium hirsutum]|nr:hypothetical protein ERO13_D03G024825v2 [Gossypium hirsutum]
MHSPNSPGPPPNGRLVGCNNITPRFPSAPITPLAVTAIPHRKRRIGIPPILIFFSVFCPSSSPMFPFHRFLLLLLEDKDFLVVASYFTENK